MAKTNNVKEIAAHYTEILKLLGQDTDREGLKETPLRYAKHLVQLIKQPAYKLTTFSAEGCTDLQFTGGMPFYSTCEHHTLPFFGEGLIAYIPSDRMAGLSKFSHVLNHFAAGFQNQERITQAVGLHLMEVLRPNALAVILKATHTCMTTRGAKAHGAYTVTSFMRGAFRSDPSAKDELTALLNFSTKV